MVELRDEFLSEEDLDLRNLSEEELAAYWNLWLHQAQATNDLDEALYSHGVFQRDPAVVAEEEVVGSARRTRRRDAPANRRRCRCHS